MSDSDGIRILPNYNLIIIDDNLNPVPSGFPGEICITSQYSISPGYNSRPDETQHQIIDMNLKRDEKASQCISAYRTGDLGRLSSEDGILTVLGRIGSHDGQVKIRGQRVELDEIAATIIRCSNNTISNAAVSWRSSDEILIAFVVLGRDAGRGSMNWVTGELGQQLPLPNYMRPSVWVPMDKIPTNSNGKVDRHAINEYPMPSSALVDQFQLNGKVINSNVSLSKDEIRVARIWEQVLREVALDTLHPNTDFFYLGGNSRNLIELRLLLEKQFAPVKIRLPELFQHSSLVEMVALVSSQNTSSLSDKLASQSSWTDWKEEVAYACQEALRPRHHSLATSPANDNEPLRLNPSGLVVVLTGATGFLGSSIAQCLVDNARVAEVHCIAIRDSSSQVHRVSVKSDKIHQHAGDLESPLLGLSHAQFQDLSQRANIIIHNGAQVSFLKTYQSLCRSNVSSTVGLCRMALVRSIPLHFVSTGAVALVPTAGTHNDTQPTLFAQSANDRIPEPESQSGYRDSKWVAEQVLEEISNQRGLHVVIHRPASIVGPGAPKLDLMAAILNISRALNLVPALESNVDGPLDLVSVQHVSSRLVDSAFENIEAATHETSTSFIHHCSDTKRHPSELRKYLEEEEGQDTRYSLVSLEEWLDAAAETDIEPLLYDFLSISFTGGRRIQIPYLM